MQNIIIMRGKCEQLKIAQDDKKSVGRCNELGGWYRSGDGTNKAWSGSTERSSRETMDIREGVHT